MTTVILSIGPTPSDTCGSFVVDCQISKSEIERLLTSAVHPDHPFNLPGNRLVAVSFSRKKIKQIERDYPHWFYGG